MIASICDAYNDIIFLPKLFSNLKLIELFIKSYLKYFGNPVENHNSII